jgi:sec-independent protein translocase protein TatC
LLNLHAFVSKHDDNDDDIYEDDGTLPEDVMDPHEKPMGFFDHLEELRWVVLKCVIVYVLFAVVIGFYLKEVNHLLLWPLERVRGSHPQLVLDLGTTAVTESFTIVIQLCCLGALVPAMPFFFFFMGQFVAPALTRAEKRMVLPVCFSSLFLFVAGVLFSFFFLVTSTLQISAELTDMFGFIMRWTPGSYYGTLSWLTIGVGISFEFPLVIVLLVYLGLLRVETLKKYRRHAIVVIFVIAAIVTPTPDPFTQTIFALPLYALFETAIFIGGRVQKKRDASALTA